MPSLKDIRNRVRSVKNTQKITRAMKLVAAAKLRRAQDAVVAARPYAALMRDTISALSAAVDPEKHPLFAEREVPRKCLLIPITSDRGLCGGFNSNLMRQVEAYRRDEAKAYEEIGVAPIGRKGNSYFARQAAPKFFDAEGLRADSHDDTTHVLAQTLVHEFLHTDIDEVYVVFNEFVSALTQRVVFQRLLPLKPATFTADEDMPPEFIFEPDEQTLFDALLPRYVQSQLLRALLESEASEMGARMTAMDSATNNASDLIDRLTLQMNRARQAIITTELMEITSGAEALKG